MRMELVGPKKEVKIKYYRLLASERYDDVKVIEPLKQMPDSDCGECIMVVETISIPSFTSRGIYGR